MALSINHLARTASSVLVLPDILLLLRSELFSPGYYSLRTGITFKSRYDAVVHYVTTEADDPHPLFSNVRYRSNSLTTGKTSALAHFVRSGAKSLLQPHELFNPHWYLEKNPEFREEARANPLLHYLTKGWTKGCRVHPLFDAAYYLDRYPDVRAAGTDPLVHYLTYGAFEGRSPSKFFDAGWYVARYPDVGMANLNPLIHYLTHGTKEGRNPSASFDTLWYLAAYPDVAATGGNPLMHYSEYGILEQRLTSARREFRLGDDFGMNKPDFADWREGRLAALHKSLLERSKKFETDGPGRDVVVVVAFSSPMSTEFGLPYQTSKRSFDDAGLQAKADVAIVTQQELRERAPLILRPDTCVVMVCEGDTIDAIGLRALSLELPRTSGVCVFDMYFEEGETVFPLLQPGANLGYLRGVDATFSRFAMTGDLCLRALRGDAFGSALELFRMALDVIARRRDWDALVHCSAPVLATVSLASCIRQARDALLDRAMTARRHDGAARVSIVICTKDNGLLLKQLVDALFSTSDHLIADVVIVSNNTTNGYAVDTIKRLGAMDRVSVIRYDKPFNFSEQCNLGVKSCSGDLLLFLNDDIVPVTPDWLDRLVVPFADPAVGMTGPLLIYPNETVQHAGMFLGFRGTAGHTLRGARLPAGDYLFMASATRDVSCLTGAVLLMRRACFDDMNGFDRALVTIFQDVDLCLRTTNLGYRLLFVPASILIHMESISIQELFVQPGIQEKRGRELGRFLRRHGGRSFTRDPFMNPCFSVEDETMRTLTC